MSTGPNTENSTISGEANAAVRSSCDNCGQSKIRCTKEKPSCQRCSERGQICSYSAPKRSGRPPQDPGQFIFKNVAPGASNSSTNVRLRSLPSEQSNEPPKHPTTVQDETMQHNVSPTYSVSDLQQLLPGGPPSSTVSTPPAFNFGNLTTNMLDSENEFWASASVLSSADLEEMLDWDHFGGDIMTTGLGDWPLESLMGDQTVATSSTCLDATSNLDKLHSTDISPFQFNQMSPSLSLSLTQGSDGSMPARDSTSSGLSSSREPSSGSGSSGNDSVLAIDQHNVDKQQQQHMRPCSCESQVMNLMAHPSPSQATQRTKADGKPAASFESVLDLNVLATNAVARILECPCMKDAYVIVILILSTCKTLEWYEAAASISTGDACSISTPNTSISGEGINGEDPSRVASQIILSRLSGIQRIVEALSAQVQELPHSEGGVSERSSYDGFARHAYSADKTVPKAMNRFLATDLMRPLHANLRNRTLELAQKVIAQMR